MNESSARLNDELDLEALARGDRVAADVLVERCRDDRYCVLDPDVFAALAALSKARSLARDWEALLAQLRSVHVDVPALKRALKRADEVDDDDDDGNEGDSQAARLLAIAGQYEFYLDQYRIPHVSFPRDGRMEAQPLDSGVLQLFLVHEYSKIYQTPPSETALRNVLQKLKADAWFGGVVHPVYVRVAPQDGKLTIDRGTPDGSAYELTSAGVAINPTPAVRFSRPEGMLPLIEADLTATPRGALEALESVTRFKEPRDLVLTTSSMLDVLGGQGPHPVTAVTGPPGAAKTTLARVIVRVTDPNVVETISAPKTKRDHFINTLSRRVVAYNNVSKIPKEISDAFCVSTEDGWDSQRAHYTNSLASVIHACSPIILTSVSNVIEEGDLGARALEIELAAVPKSERLSDRKFWAKFKPVGPTLLGGLLNALCEGLRRYDSIVAEDPDLPRLASFAMTSISCETAFGWPEGTFLKCFAETAAAAANEILSGSKVATVFLQFMEDKKEWTGTASELLKDMEALVRRPLRVAEEALQMAKSLARDKDNRAAQQKLAKATSDYKDAQAQVHSTLRHHEWPGIHNALSRRLRSLDTQLNSAGVWIRWPTSHKTGRKIVVTGEDIKVPEVGESQNPSSPIDPSSPSDDQGCNNNGLNEKNGESVVRPREDGPSSGDEDAQVDQSDLPDFPHQPDSSGESAEIPKPNGSSASDSTLDQRHTQELRKERKGFAI